LKWIRRVALAVVVLVLAAGLSYWFLPASVAVPLLASRTRGVVLADLSGTLWDGRAGRVTGRDGRELGRATWRLGRDAILGRIHLDLHLDGPIGRFDGHLERTDPDRLDWTGVDFRLDAAALAGPTMTSDLAPDGVVEGKVPRADLQGNWPVAMEADVRWHAAAVRTPEGQVALGGFALKAASDGGVLRATLVDDGHGPLAANAALAASPLGWRLDGKLAPRVANAALSHLIARFGPVGRDGTVNLQRKAGLAPSNSP
jgi:general secretion pathway protein N